MNEQVHQHINELDVIDTKYTVHLKQHSILKRCMVHEVLHLKVKDSPSKLIKVDRSSPTAAMFYFLFPRGWARIRIPPIEDIARIRMALKGISSFFRTSLIG